MPFSPSKCPQLTRQAPINIPVYYSQVKQETTSFIWAIKGVMSIKNNNLWHSPKCQFTAGDHLWRLSLYTSPNGDFLYARPTLLEPRDTTAVFYIKFYVLNSQGIVVHASPFTCDHPAIASSYSSTSAESFMDPSFKWEVLKFNNRPVDVFSSLVFNDTLSLLVEMTVFKDVQKNGP